MTKHRVWAEISRERLLQNFRRLRLMTAPRADLLAVVKANGYGHGVDICAPLLAQAGVEWLGVTSAEEGARVRDLCPEQKILLMSGIGWEDREAAEQTMDRNLTPVVWEHHHLELLESVAAGRGLQPKSFAVHLEIDTGMSRQGVRVDGGPEGLEQLRSLLRCFHPASPLRLSGVMTHFSAPEMISSTSGNPQLPLFLLALKEIAAQGQRPEWIHAGNSTTLIAGLDREKAMAMARHAGARAMIRPGLALYGYVDRITRDGEPVAEPQSFAESLGLAPVLSWKTRICSLHTIESGASAGYDNTFVAHRRSRLALLPVGYADGISRRLSNCGQVLIRGRRATIAGRVSMDQTIVDVTDIADATIGDEAVLLGRQGEDSIDAWELAEKAETIPWEILCAIHPRVPRIAVD